MIHCHVIDPTIFAELMIGQGSDTHRKRLVGLLDIYVILSSFVTSGISISGILTLLHRKH